MRKKFLLSVLLVVTVLLMGCAGGGGKAVQPTGGELVRLWDDPPTLDPHLTSDVSASVVVVEVFGGLVTINTDLKIVPDLAEKWTVSPDGKTYTFTLRSNVKFHNGKAVTANDFKWSLERIADTRTQSTTVDTYMGDIMGLQDKLNGKSQEVSGVKVINDQTL